MYYYLINDVVCCSFARIKALTPLQQPPKAPEVFLFESGTECRSSYALTDPRLLLAEEESVEWLNENALPMPRTLEEPLRQAFAAGGMRAVNVNRPDWKKLLNGAGKSGKKRVHILAMGDVGGTLLTGLRLLGGDVIESIGICDLNENAAKRWEFEAGQIQYPWEYDKLPPVEIISPEELFRCDVVIFVASKGIPPVGSEIKDVRMAQFEANRAIAAHYAQIARRERFEGLFCQVSDPVDPLARVMYVESNKDSSGHWDGRGLRPEQIQGYGLGVMNARAAYYAQKESRFGRFLTEGRAFGPHGEGLVIADSIQNYNDKLSRELTEKTVEANLVMRSWGYKPYVAPALSSAAISILLTMRGEWHYGSVFLGGVYMGCKNRVTRLGVEIERLPLPESLMSRIRDAEAVLKRIV